MGRSRWVPVGQSPLAQRDSPGEERRDDPGATPTRSNLNARKRASDAPSEDWVVVSPQQESEQNGDGGVPVRAAVDVQDQSDVPQRQSSFIGLPPIRRSSTFGVGRLSSEFAEESAEAAPAQPENRVGEAPTVPPVPEDEVLAAALEGQTLGNDYSRSDEGILDKGKELAERSPTPQHAVLAQDGAVAQPPQQVPAPPTLTPPLENRPTLEESSSLAVPGPSLSRNLPPAITGNPIQLLPPGRGQWNLQESHLSEPLISPSRKRPSSSASQTPSFVGYDKETEAGGPSKDESSDEDSGDENAGVVLTKEEPEEVEQQEQKRKSVPAAVDVSSDVAASRAVPANSEQPTPVAPPVAVEPAPVPSNAVPPSTELVNTAQPPIATQPTNIITPAAAAVPPPQQPTLTRPQGPDRFSSTPPISAHRYPNLFLPGHPRQGQPQPHIYNQPVQVPGQPFIQGQPNAYGPGGVALPPGARPPSSGGESRRNSGLFSQIGDRITRVTSRPSSQVGPKAPGEAAGDSGSVASVATGEAATGRERRRSSFFLNLKGSNTGGSGDAPPHSRDSMIAHSPSTMDQRSPATPDMPPPDRKRLFFSSASKANKPVEPRAAQGGPGKFIPSFSRSSTAGLEGEGGRDPKQPRLSSFGGLFRRSTGLQEGAPRQQQQPQVYQQKPGTPNSMASSVPARPGTGPPASQQHHSPSHSTQLPATQPPQSAGGGASVGPQPQARGRSGTTGSLPHAPVGPSPLSQQARPVGTPAPTPVPAPGPTPTHDERGRRVSGAGAFLSNIFHSRSPSKLKENRLPGPAAPGVFPGQPGGPPLGQMPYGQFGPGPGQVPPGYRGPIQGQQGGPFMQGAVGVPGSVPPGFMQQRPGLQPGQPAPGQRVGPPVNQQGPPGFQQLQPQQLEQQAGQAPFLQQGPAPVPQQGPTQQSFVIAPGVVRQQSPVTQQGPVALPGQQQERAAPQNPINQQGQVLPPILPGPAGAPGQMQDWRPVAVQQGQEQAAPEQKSLQAEVQGRPAEPVNRDANQELVTARKEVTGVDGNVSAPLIVAPTAEVRERSPEVAAPQQEASQPASASQEINPPFQGTVTVTTPLASPVPHSTKEQRPAFVAAAAQSSGVSSPTPSIPTPTQQHATESTRSSQVQVQNQPASSGVSITSVPGKPQSPPPASFEQHQPSDLLGVRKTASPVASQSQSSASGADAATVSPPQVPTHSVSPSQTPVSQVSPLVSQGGFVAGQTPPLGQGVQQGRTTTPQGQPVGLAQQAPPQGQGVVQGQQVTPQGPTIRPVQPVQATPQGQRMPQVQPSPQGQPIQSLHQPVQPGQQFYGQPIPGQWRPGPGQPLPGSAQYPGPPAPWAVNRTSTQTSTASAPQQGASVPPQFRPGQPPFVHQQTAPPEGGSKWYRPSASPQQAQLAPAQGAKPERSSMKSFLSAFKRSSKNPEPRPQQQVPQGFPHGQHPGQAGQQFVYGQPIPGQPVPAQFARQPAGTSGPVQVGPGQMYPPGFVPQPGMYGRPVPGMQYGVMPQGPPPPPQQQQQLLAPGQQQRTVSGGVMTLPSQQQQQQPHPGMYGPPPQAGQQHPVQQAPPVSGPSPPAQSADRSPPPQGQYQLLYRLSMGSTSAQGSPATSAPSRQTSIQSGHNQVQVQSQPQPQPQSAGPYPRSPSQQNEVHPALREGGAMVSPPPQQQHQHQQQGIAPPVSSSSPVNGGVSGVVQPTIPPQAVTPSALVSRGGPPAVSVAPTTVVADVNKPLPLPLPNHHLAPERPTSGVSQVSTDSPRSQSPSQQQQPGGESKTAPLGGHSRNVSQMTTNEETAVSEDTTSANPATPIDGANRTKQLTVDTAAAVVTNRFSQEDLYNATPRKLPDGSATEEKKVEPPAVVVLAKEETQDTTQATQATDATQATTSTTDGQALVTQATDVTEAEEQEDEDPALKEWKAAQEEKRQKMLMEAQQEKILVEGQEGLPGGDVDEDVPQMSATSYPGQEWNPYAMGYEFYYSRE